MAARLDLHRQSKLQAGGSAGTYTNPPLKGVTVAWLAEALDMPEASVRYRLRNCPVKMTRQRGEKMQVKLYDLKVAMRYLVAPAFSTKEYMRSLKRGDLPPQLQESVWNAMLKRQKWEENAQQLWRTEAIREVLGETFQSLKFTLQLWVETVERQTELTDKQRAVIVGMVDALQADMYEGLVKNMHDRSTGPQFSDLEYRFGETETVSAMMVEDDDLSDDEEQDIEGMV
jgi:hypothetical protein